MSGCMVFGVLSRMLFSRPDGIFSQFQDTLGFPQYGAIAAHLRRWEVFSTLFRLGVARLDKLIVYLHHIRSNDRSS